MNSLFTTFLHSETVVVGLLLFSLISRYMTGDGGTAAAFSGWGRFRGKRLPLRFSMGSIEPGGVPMKGANIGTSVAVMPDQPPSKRGDKPSRLSVRQAIANLQDLVQNRLIMGLATVFALLVYVWNAPATIDYPLYDEATYFFRGYSLYTGNFQIADLTNFHTSPLQVVYYTVWFALLHTSLLYPWVMASSLLLMGMGIYLLLSRLLPLTLSLVLALVAIIASAPIVPGNADYYLGAGILWMSLALLTKRVWQRGLSLLGVLISVYARPEFEVLLFALVIALVVYEWRAWKRWEMTLKELVIGYAPAVVGLTLSAVLLFSLPSGSDYRSTVALPWSYNDYYNYVYPEQFHGIDSYSNPWVIYEKDFGPVEPRTLTNTMLAMTHNPAKMGGYLLFNAERLLASFGTAAFATYRWSYSDPGTTVTVRITPQTTWQFGLGVLIFAWLAMLSYLWLRRKGHLDKVPIRLDPLALIGIGCLLALVPSLLLVNPHQRFWMLYPLTLFLLGAGLLVIGTAVVFTLAGFEQQRVARLAKLRLALAGCCIVFAVLLMPQPYAATPQHPNAATVNFLRQYVPDGSTIIGEPVNSYADFLAAEGVHLQPVLPTNYTGSRLVSAFEANPALTYALLTPSYSQDAYQQWFADWQATFPQWPWSQVATLPSSNLQLYALQPHGSGYGRISYALWLAQAKQMRLNTNHLPSFDALDFDHPLVWQSDDKGHRADPSILTAWQIPVKGLSMHPYYPGIDAYPTVSSNVEATIPASWSGQSILFFATLAPYAAAQPDAQGTKLTLSIAQPSYSQVVEILNVPLSQQQWMPFVLKLPTLTNAVQLHVNIQPRVSINNDTTFFSFIGVTQDGGN